MQSPISRLLIGDTSKSGESDSDLSGSNSSDSDSDSAALSSVPPSPTSPPSSLKLKTSAASPDSKAAAIASHRQALADASARLDSVQAGTWMIIVHVIEVRELRSNDPDGSADPVVLVELDFGEGNKKKAHTRVVNNDRNAVFDETFKFEFPSLSRPDLEMGQLGVMVVDADISVGNHGSGSVVGSWSADVLDAVYSRPDHELYRSYVCLENDDASSAADAGAQGFLKLTVAVVGPGDRQKLHDLEKEQQAERKGAGSGADGAMSTCLPPSMGKMELRFLVIQLHSIQNLCTPSSLIYVTVDFGSTSFSTNPTKTFSQPHTALTIPARYSKIDQSLHLAVLHPTMSQSIRISVHERSHLGPLKTSRLVATCRILKLSRVRAYPAKFKNLSLPFYGAPPPPQTSSLLSSPSSAITTMNRRQENASHYRGRLVVTVKEKGGEKKDGREKAQENK